LGSQGWGCLEVLLEHNWYQIKGILDGGQKFKFIQVEASPFSGKCGWILISGPNFRRHTSLLQSFQYIFERLLPFMHVLWFDLGGID
jgi:hypothetical protein